MKYTHIPSNYESIGLPFTDTERQMIFEMGWKEGRNALLNELVK